MKKVTKWWNEIKRKRKLKKMRRQMDNKCKELDIQKRFDYYSQTNDDFRDLYLEYERLRNEGV